MKGPAAATLYGIQASNGVVRITTKHGTAGPPQWNSFQRARRGRPTTTLTHSTTTVATPPRDRHRRRVRRLLHHPERAGRPLHPDLAADATSRSTTPSTRPYKAGLRQRYGANVSGGSDQVTYFVSGAYENEIGPFRLPADRGGFGPRRPRHRPRQPAPARTRSRSTASGPTSPPTSPRPSTSTRRSGFLTQQHPVHRERQQLPDGERQRHGQRQPARGRTAAGSTSRRELFAELANQAANRFTGGFTGNWRRRAGSPAARRSATTWSTAPTCSSSPPARWPTQLRIAPASGSTTASTSPRPRWTSAPPRGSSSATRSGPVRRSAASSSATSRGATSRPAAGFRPAREASPARAPPRPSDTLVESRSIGSYVEEEINLKRAALPHRRAAVRRQQRLRPELQRHGVSQGKRVLARCPTSRSSMSCAINTLRLRAAFGASGQQPGTTDALRFFNAVAGKKDGVGTTGVSFASLGQRQPQARAVARVRDGPRCRAVQGPGVGGAHLLQQAHQGRADPADIAPSLGASASPSSSTCRASGTAASSWRSRSRIIDKPSIAWDLTLSGSTTKNKILELGDRGEPDLRRVLPAAPCRLSGRRILGADACTFNDANSDGIIDLDRGEPQRQRGLPRLGAADQGGVAQQPAGDLRREGRARHPVRLPRRPPGGQFAGAVPLLLGAELPRTATTRPPRSSSRRWPRRRSCPEAATRWRSSSPAGSSSCASCRSPSRPPIAGPGPSGPAG